MRCSLAQQPIITYVPGAGATELAQSLGALHSFHEEIAYAVAYGAALRGRPSICLIKSHGVAKAMNAVIASLVAGTSAPMVTIVFDDPTGKTSDHAFMARGMLEGAGAKVFSRVEDAVAFSDSEKKPAFVCTSEKINALPNLKFKDRYPQIEKRVALLNPLQSEWQQDRNRALPAINCPADLPPHLRSTAVKYEPWIVALKECGFDWVTGDAGTSSLFGLPPHLFVDVCNHMGGSIPLAIGASLTGARTLAVTGDFSFLSMGAASLLEADRRGIDLSLVVFCNREASATGGQEVDLAWVRSTLPDYVQTKEFSEASIGQLKEFFSQQHGIRAALILFQV